MLSCAVQYKSDHRAAYTERVGMGSPCSVRAN